MENPFAATHYSDQSDLELVQASLKGNKQSLESLILRHQPFIYNVSLKMTMSPQEAEDITQEVLLKVITSLIPGRCFYKLSEIIDPLYDWT